MRKDNPLVSVLMTAYNREKYIAEAIESVLASTYINFELIIVDDCSKDRTVEIARNYEVRDKRIKVFVNENNLGDYANRNRAASLAKGKYLKYVDSDDYIYPHGLDVLVNMMVAFPEAGWGLCSLIQIKEKPYPFLLSPYQAYLHNFFGPGLFHKAPLSSIIKKSVFDETGGFNPGRMVGDYEMWLRLAQKYPVLLMPDGLVWYREHEGQEIVFINQYLAVYHKIKIFYLTHPDCPLNADEVKSVFDNENSRYKKELFKSILKFNKMAALENFKYLKINKNPTHTSYPIH